MIRPPPRSTLFPYPTLSRSRGVHLADQLAEPLDQAGHLVGAGGGGDAGAQRLVGVGEVPQHRALRTGQPVGVDQLAEGVGVLDRKSTRLNSSHANISYAVFC